MNPSELGRLLWIEEALAAGDTPTAHEAILSLLDDAGPPLAGGRARGRWCPLTDWPGLIEKHERVLHADQLIDLEERRRAA